MSHKLRPLVLLTVNTGLLNPVSCAVAPVYLPIRKAARAKYTHSSLTPRGNAKGSGVCSGKNWLNAQKKKGLQTCILMPTHLPFRSMRRWGLK